MRSTKRPTALQGTQAVLEKTAHVLTHPIRQAMEDFFVFPRSNKATQIMLAMKYKEMVALGLPLPQLEDIEFRAYSQFGEDGILLYLFALIGTTNKKCVEICGGGGYDNTANLIINHGWNGLFFEGGEKGVKRGKQFYARCADTKIWPPKLVHAWVTTENINSLLGAQDYNGEIDLLSLDMDGVDYWIWKAITCIRPRVVVLEYNNLLGPDVALTVPYKPNFISEHNSASPLNYQLRRVRNTFEGKHIADRLDNYYGASLSAFVKLGKQKGYRLVGCERYGFNAFFVREDIAIDLLPEIATQECFKHPYTQYAISVRRKQVLDKEWVEV